MGFDRAISEQLELVARKCIGSKNGNAQNRIDSLIRSLSAAKLGDNTSRLRAQIWPVLLELAEQDIAAGIALIDTHWQSMQAPTMLSALSLHESPELAYRLAVLFQPHRPLFASEMMGESVVFSSYQLEKLNATERDALQQIMDESCRLLASWISAHPQDAWAASLRAIECLLQYGNPCGCVLDNDPQYGARHDTRTRPCRAAPVHAIDGAHRLLFGQRFVARNGESGIVQDLH
ncbi:hypothetical protein LP420_36435 [Massilia sp. B-10]|nr:hypothetical protein LP420_36435 [Massilia sp. B-10]